MQGSIMITAAVMVLVISLTCANNTPVLSSGNRAFAQDVHPSMYDYNRTAPNSVTQPVFPQLIEDDSSKTAMTRDRNDQEQGKSHDLTESHISEVLVADRNLHRPGQSVDHSSSVLYHRLKQLLYDTLANHRLYYDQPRQAFLTEIVETHRDATVETSLRRVVDELRHHLSYDAGNIPPYNHKTFSNIPHSSSVNSSYTNEDKMNGNISISERDRYNASNNNEKGQDVVFVEDDAVDSTRSLVEPPAIPLLSPSSGPDLYSSRYKGSSYRDNDGYYFPGHPQYQDQGWRRNRRIDSGVKSSLNTSEIPGFVAPEDLTTGDAGNPTSGGGPVVRTPTRDLGQGPRAEQGDGPALQQLPRPGRPLGTRPLSGIPDTALDFPRRPTSSTPPPAEAINPLSLLMSVRWTTPPPITTTAAPGLSRRQVSQALTLLARLQDVLSREVGGATQLPPGGTASESASPPAPPPLLFSPAGPTASFPSLEGYPGYPRPARYPLPGGLYPQYPLPPKGCLGGGASTSTSTGPGTAAAAAAAGGGGCGGGGSTSTSTSAFGSVGSAAPGSSVSAGGSGPQGSVVRAPAPVGPPSPPVSLSISTDDATSGRPPSPPSEDEYERVVTALNTLLSFINRSQTQPEDTATRRTPAAPTNSPTGVPAQSILLSPVRRPPPIATTTSRPISRPFLDQLYTLLARPSAPRPPPPPFIIQQQQNPIHTGHIGQVSTSAPSSFRVSANVYVPILSELLRGPTTTTTLPSLAAAAGSRPLTGPAAAPLVRTPQHEDLTDQGIQKLIQQGYTLG